MAARAQAGMHRAGGRDQVSGQPSRSGVAVSAHKRAACIVHHRL